MAQEKHPPTDPSPSTSEDVDAANAGESDSPARSLNRAERRAQARGKKTGAQTLNPSVPHLSDTRGPGARGHGPASQPRFPRTGHK